MMIPFRIFDRQSKQIWLIINYQPNAFDGEGGYLASLDNDAENDGDFELFSMPRVLGARLVGFLEDD